MIVFGAFSPKATVDTEILADTFTGASLDTDEWTAATKGASSTVTQNDNLILTLTTDAISSARILSTTKIPTLGLVDIEFDWTPGKLYFNAYGRPYLAIIPASPSRDSVNYEFPLYVPAIKLGIAGNTTVRTKLAIGKFGAGFVDYDGSVTETTGTWNENTTYSIKWRVNWQHKTMSLWVDDVLLLENTAFIYTISGDHFLEIGNCDYGAASNAIEKFDNLVVTQTR
jgi:hypothetical protein